MASWEHFQRKKTTGSQGWMVTWVFLEWQAQTQTLLFTKVRKILGIKEDLDGRAVSIRKVQNCICPEISSSQKKISQALEIHHLPFPFNELWDIDRNPITLNSLRLCILNLNLTDPPAATRGYRGSGMAALRVGPRQAPLNDCRTVGRTRIPSRTAGPPPPPPGRRRSRVMIRVTGMSHWQVRVKPEHG
jgi:hypothetical protein